MQLKLFVITAMFCLIINISYAQWQLSGTNEYNNTGNVSVGTIPTNFKFAVGGGLLANSISNLSLWGYSNTTDNRSVSVQQMGNANSATQYFFMNGGLGTASTFGSPMLTSMYTPTFGFECNDNYLNIITASAGTNVTPVRVMSFLPSGNILIGKTTQSNGAYILDVNGSGRFNQVVVNTTGADYVFDSKYKLPSLHAVETYIKKYHHLQGIQSASEMQEDGLNVGNNQTALLGKIEELTLYLLQQNKKIEAQQKRIEHLENLLRKKGIK